ncbi:MAG TPA: trigger factor [Thermoanaerobaculia bacterium]|nr:trigger factor [Thermoanaerobaculia bacterium]
MTVVVSVEEVGPCRKQLTVEVPAPAVEAETQRVLKEFGQRVRVPGFRKGKVPTELVRRRFQKDIDKEVIDRLLPRYWHQAQAESAIDPLLPPEVEEVQEISPGAPLTFVATVETRPEIELRNIHDFDLPNPAVEPGIVEIDDAVDDLRRQLADWAPVERPASRGDLVSAELTEQLPAPTGEGDQYKDGEPQTAEIEVGDERVWEELSLALSGLAAGQETTFTRREGEGDGARERHFRVKVNAVKERDLPPLDDELAARVSPELETLEALREALKNRLRAGKEQGRREQRQKALLDQLRERHPLALPQGVLHRETEHLINDYAQSLARRGVDLERSGIDWNKTAEEMTPIAERRVHSQLLLDAIAQAEAIDLAEEEFEAALAILARAQKTSTSALRKALDEDGRLASFRSQLRRDKVVRHLLGELPENSAGAEIPAAAGEPGPAVPENT